MLVILFPMLNWIKMTNLSGGTNPLSDRDGLKSNMHSLTPCACMHDVRGACRSHSPNERRNEWADHFMASSAHDADAAAAVRTEEEDEEVPRLL